MTGAESYSIFADESGLTERYIAYGAILLPTASLDAAEESLQRFADSTIYKEREFSFKKCSRREVELYKGFIGSFWSLQGYGLDFRAMVVDTHQNPMRCPQFGCETWEDGFYKFWYQFLVESARIVASNAKSFRLVVGDKTDEYPYRTEVLQTTVKGGLSGHLGSRFEVFELGRGRPKEQRVHQLADCLLGAVTHRLNKGDDASGHKTELREHVQAKVGKALNWDFGPHERPFNIWSFTAKGQKRWAPGSWTDKA